MFYLVICVHLNSITVLRCMKLLCKLTPGNICLVWLFIYSKRGSSFDAFVATQLFYRVGLKHVFREVIFPTKFKHSANYRQGILAVLVEVKMVITLV